MGYSTTGKHYIAVNGEMISEAISHVNDKPYIKTKGKITLPSMSASVISVKTPPFHSTNNIPGT